jgi:hypothetical protein
VIQSLSVTEALPDLTSPESTTTTFADDTAVLATDSGPAIASQKLQKKKNKTTCNPNLVLKMVNKI